MANRVTSNEVKEIYSTTLSADVIIPYIDTANSLVTEKLGSSDLGTARLADIERYLAAHMIVSTRERQARREQIGDASITYSEIFGEGLKSTTFGQMVLLLDTTAIMSSMTKRRVRIVAIDSFDDD